MNEQGSTWNVLRRRVWKKLSFLIRALFSSVRQGRVMELMYGLYCCFRHPPSKVIILGDHTDFFSLLDKRQLLRTDNFFLSREELVDIYGKNFDVRSLPHDFSATRSESLVCGKKFLIIGEYGDKSSRIAYINEESCSVERYYDKIPGVRHIHSIHRIGESNDILISTGDTCKFLDLWSIATNKLAFVRRVKKKLGGFTAAIHMGGRSYFGTDFSGRPNYIETNTGEKFFFPKKAYGRAVITFRPLLDRFIVAINGDDLDQVDGRNVLTVFDFTRGKFVFCEYISRNDDRGGFEFRVPQAKHPQPIL